MKIDNHNVTDQNADGLPFFKKNSKAYANSLSHSSGDDLSALIDRLPNDEDIKALDVATGTGFTGFRLAQKYKLVVGLDVTSEMLLEARNLAAEKRLDNLVFVLGRSEKMPFLDHAFDVVTCRRAAHHFSDKKKFVSEVRRVLKPGGTFGFVDMLSPENDKDDSFNKLERIRDPTHLSAETKNFWENAVLKEGFSIEFSQTYQERISFEKWLSPVMPNDDAGIKCRNFLKENEHLKRMLSYDSDLIIKTRLVMTAISPDSTNS
ncbi:MAG: methyltransferase domain-containing protein [Thermoplasmataceae archaeon]|jgi:ubiquinone/menaquinone biosynthesis C-methylase UbiE